MVVLGLLRLDGRTNRKLLPSQRISTISLLLHETVVATWVVQSIACSCVPFAALRIIAFAATPLSWSVVAEQPVNLNQKKACKGVSLKQVCGGQSICLCRRVHVCVWCVSQSLGQSTRSRIQKRNSYYFALKHTSTSRYNKINIVLHGILKTANDNNYENRKSVWRAVV